MASQTSSQLQPTIGIECHVQLKTKTKLFSAVGNDARDAKPNTLISHIDLGMPGALPVLNEKAVEYAVRAGFALGVEPQKYSYFERKHYFYPDLPKGYQITQLSHAIIVGGQVAIDVDGQTTKVRINRVQMEEDAGKSTHPAGKDHSLVDLNRAGTPLLEIVSEPDMHSATQAKAFAKELYLLMRYADVSDANMFYGNMRFDVNVSLGAGSKLGTRTETKNLNSFRAVEKAVEYEVKRQTEVLEKGGEVIQETRGWDDAKQKTFSQRTKEEAHDYRYMPEPDLPPIELDDEYIDDIKKSMPVMPGEWRQHLVAVGLDNSAIETLLDGEIENVGISYLPAIKANIEDKELAKFLANWFVNIMIPLVKEGKFKLGQDQHLKLEVMLYDLIKTNKLSSTNAKALFVHLAGSTELPDDIEAYAHDKGYIQESDEDAIAEVVKQVLAQNAQAAEDVKNGEMKAIGFLVGQVMKTSKGQANPELAQKLIKQQLGL